MLIGAWQSFENRDNAMVSTLSWLAWDQPYVQTIWLHERFYVVQMSGATLGLKLCSWCTTSKPMGLPGMPECIAQRQLGQLVINGKDWAQPGSSYEASGQKMGVIALMWLYTWCSNLCSIWTGLTRSTGIFLYLWHDLVTAWIATYQVMQKLLNLSCLWPAVDVNNVCIWVVSPTPCMVKGEK